MRQIKLRHRPRHADVAQSPLLLETLRVLGRHAVREQPLFDAADEHQWKLQALGRMQGHQLDAVLVLVGLGVTGLERGMREKGVHLGQAGVLVILELELAAGVDQFLEVLDPVLALAVATLLEMLAQMRGLDDERRRARAGPRRRCWRRSPRSDPGSRAGHWPRARPWRRRATDPRPPATGNSRNRAHARVPHPASADRYPAAAG